MLTMRSNKWDKSTVAEIQSLCETYKKLTVDKVAYVQDTYMDENGFMRFVGAGPEYDSQPNKDALMHFAQFAKGTKRYPIRKHMSRAVDHLMEVSPSARAAVINDTLQTMADNGNRTLRWRGFDYGDGLVTRATCSGNGYGVFDPADMSEVIERVANDTKISPYVDGGYITLSPDFGLVRWVMPGRGREIASNGYRQVYSAGVMFKTGATRNSSIVACQFIQGTSCSNSIRLDKDSGVWRNHTRGVAMSSIVHDVFRVLHDAAGGEHIEEALNAIAEAAIAEMGDPFAALKTVAEVNGLKELETQFYRGMQSQGGNTRLGVINGITATAQRVEDESKREWLEEVAGRMLMAKDENHFMQIARSKFKREIEVDA